LAEYLAGYPETTYNEENPARMGVSICTGNREGISEVFLNYQLLQDKHGYQFCIVAP
jgi:hypothetical protein